MKNNKHIHSYMPAATAIILAALLVLLSPLTPWMPPMGAVVALLVAAVLVVLFAGFVMNEQGGDERDIVHQMNAGRIAYLSGLAVLALALVIQGFSHHIDSWVLGAIGFMVLAKVAARFYFGRYR